MSIKITKMKHITENDSSQDKNYIETKLYGHIEITDSVNDDYIYFDTVDGYELFINTEVNDLKAVLPIKSESIQDENLDIDDEITNIKNNYNIKFITFSEGDQSIIIKGNKDELLKIKSDYEDNKFLSPMLMTDDILFLDIKDSDIKLEDDNALLDKIADQDMKNILTKAGVKLNGNENRERLKGMIQGALANNSK